MNNKWTEAADQPCPSCVRGPKSSSLVGLTQKGVQPVTLTLFSSKAHGSRGRLYMKSCGSRWSAAEVARPNVLLVRAI